MAYRKHSRGSRKYQKSHSTTHNSSEPETSATSEQAALPPAAPVEEPVSSNEKKKSQPFSFLTSLFSSGDRGERGGKSGNPIFTILDHDIYFDDLLLAGLIILLLTDKFEDEILILILAYLLIDII